MDEDNQGVVEVRVQKQELKKQTLEAWWSCSRRPCLFPSSLKHPLIECNVALASRHVYHLPGEKEKKKKENRVVLWLRLDPSRSGDSEHHWSSNDDVIRDGAIGRNGVDEVEVDDTRQALRSLASTVGESSECGTGGGAANSEGTGLGLSRSRGLNRELLGTSSQDLLLGSVHGDGGEGSQDQVAASGARLDEGSGEREDLLGRQGGIEGVGGRSSTGHDADEALVASLDRVDGSGSSKHLGIRDDGCGAEVGGHTDLLENGGGLHHGLGRRKGLAKVVLAGLDGLDACLGEGALDDLDVGGLGGTNGNEVVDLGLRQAQGEELVLANGSEALLVEAGLEPLQSQGTMGWGC